MAILAVAMVLVLALLGNSLLGLTYGEHKMSVQQLQQMQVYYIADAGVEHALAMFLENPDFAGEKMVWNENFAGGTVKVELTKKHEDNDSITINIESLAAYKSNQRTLLVTANIDPGGKWKIKSWHEKYHVFPKNLKV